MAHFEWDDNNMSAWGHEVGYDSGRMTLLTQVSLLTTRTCTSHARKHSAGRLTTTNQLRLGTSCIGRSTLFHATQWDLFFRPFVMRDSAGPAESALE
jgi:hypothetical protein